MVSVNRAVGIIVTIFVAAIMAAALMPAALGGFAGTETATYNQSVGETVELQPGLNSTLDSVNANTNASYTVNASGDTASVTVVEGGNETVTVDGSDVTLNLTEARSNSATTRYEYPTTYGWGSAGTLWGIMGVIVVLPVLLFFVGRATDTL